MDAIIEALSDFMWDVLRMILWFLDKFILIIVDYLYDIVQTFFGMKVSSFSFIWDVYAVVCAALIIFTLFRIFAMVFQSLWGDDDGLAKLGGNTVRRVIGMLLVMSLIPIAVPFASDAFAGAAVAAPAIFTTEEIHPSDVIISSGMADFSGSLNTEISLDVPEDQRVVDVIEDINERDEDDEYVWIPDTSNLFLILIVSAISAYCFVFISIQIVQRFIGILQKIVLAPMAVSGIVDPNSNSAQLWVKLILSDFLTNFFQILFIWISLLVATNLPAGFNGLAKGLAFVGSLFAIMVAPSGIAQLLGNDSGATAGMQMMQHVQTMGTLATAAATTTMAIGGAAKSIAGWAGNKGLDTAAMGAYAAGRAMGGRDLDPHSTSGDNNSSGGGGAGGLPGGGHTDSPGGSGGSRGSGGFGGVGSHGGSDSSGGSGGYEPSYDTYAAGYGGADAAAYDSQYDSAGNSSYMNDASYADGYPASDETTSAGQYQNAQYEEYTAPSSYVGSDGIQHYSDNRVSDPGTYAGSYADHARNPFQGMASYMASRVYQRSASRIFNSAPQRRAMKENASPMQRAQERKERRQAFVQAVSSPFRAPTDAGQEKNRGEL